MTMYRSNYHHLLKLYLLYKVKLEILLNNKCYSFVVV